MTDKLPPNLLALFAPRPPLRWVPPSDCPPSQRKTAKIEGIGAFLQSLQEYKASDISIPTESWLERKDRKKVEHTVQVESTLKNLPDLYKPHEDPNIRGDPFKTLIVSRLSYDATEGDLEREFSRYGRIERIRMIKDTIPRKRPKPHRGYAFIVFEREKDFQAALKAGDGVRIKDRRVKVDFERGRTVVGWRPRRFGGGLGGRGYSRAMLSRPMTTGNFVGGGFRGSQRGDFKGKFGGRGGGFGSRGSDFQQNGSDPPSFAPSGPGGGRGGHRGEGQDGNRSFGNGYGDGGGRFHDDRHGGGHLDGSRFGDRDRFQERDRRVTGSNMEPIRPRDARDRDNHRDGYRDDDRDNQDGRDSRDSHRDRDHRSSRGPRDSRDGGGYRGNYDRSRNDSRKRTHDGPSFDEPDARRPRRT